MGDNQLHQHHALQLVLAEEPVRVHVQGAPPLRGRALLIGADHPHQLEPSSKPVCLFYLERESQTGALLSSLFSGARVLPARQARALQDLFSNALQSMELDRQVALLLAGDEVVPPWGDPRIEASLAFLAHNLQVPMSLREVARASGLSAGRYAQLFRAHCGMPLRPYLRWLRLRRASQLAAEGHSLTEAAHAAGFADSAHLSRTCRSSFGITPQQLAALLRA